MSTSDPCRLGGKASAALWMRALPVLQDIARRHGTPFYAYSRPRMTANLRALQEALTGGVRLMYAMKANPSVEVVRALVRAGAGVEVASAGELLLAVRAGAESGDIILSGPGKSKADHELAVSKGIAMVNVESLAEARRLSVVARRRGRTMRVALRVNPRQGVGGARLAMGGRASPFGVDEERADRVLERMSNLPGIIPAGVHVYAGTQINDAQALVDHVDRCMDLARRLLGVLPDAVLNLGGGFGDDGLELSVLRSGMARLARRCGQGGAPARLLAEPGRFLVSSAGCYVSRVVEIKRSRGQWFVILDGGVNHRAAGSLQGVIRRNPELCFPSHGGQVFRRGHLVGPLCTPLDRLAEDVALPAGLKAGDLVLFPGVGAYARSAAPLCFLSHDWPAEYMLGPGGAVRRISPRLGADQLWDFQKKQCSPNV